MQHEVRPRGFDVNALYAALDARRRLEGLSWVEATRAMWDESNDLNAQRSDDHPISASTVTGMPRRGDVSCQHALFMLRWLGQAPEDFVVSPRPRTVGVPLPDADPAHRLRWDLGALYTALNDARLARAATWQQAADRLYCTPNQLTGLRTAKFATGMRLAMRVCQALAQPAARFVYAADW